VPGWHCRHVNEKASAETISKPFSTAPTLGLPSLSERASVGEWKHYERPVRLLGLRVLATGLGAGALDEATLVMAGTGEGSLVGW
jgi:hypothetical protein